MPGYIQTDNVVLARHLLGAMRERFSFWCYIPSKRVFKRIASWLEYLKHS